MITARLLAMVLLFYVFTVADATSQPGDTVEAAIAPPGGNWALNARVLVGLSLPMVPSYSSSGGSSVSSQVSNYTSTGSISGYGGGWDANDITWSYLVDATLHYGLGKYWYLGATLGFDRRGKQTRHWMDEDFYTRLHAYYLKLGPQIAYMYEGSGIYLGLNGGVPLQVRFSSDTSSIAYTDDGLDWSTLLEIQSGLRLYPFELLGGQVLFNVDVGFTLTPMYTIEDRGFNKMFTLRTGFSYYTELSK